MTKRIIIATIGIIAIIGVLAGIKFFQIGRMTSQATQFVPPPAPVTTAKVRTESWVFWLIMMHFGPTLFVI